MKELPFKYIFLNIPYIPLALPNPQKTLLRRDRKWHPHFQYRCERDS